MTTSLTLTRFLAVLCCFTLISCARTSRTVEGSNEAQGEVAEAQAADANTDAVKASPEAKSAEQLSQISVMQARIQDLESRISAMNEKLNERLAQKTNEPEGKVVRPPVAAARGIPKEEIVHDESVDLYREAKILFDSNRHSDAILEFSEFIKNFPNHAFAPGAQYYLGAAYYKQKEYKLAEEEWSRGLISYPHSQFTADTLKGLMEVSNALKKSEKVTYFSQRLLMLFPNSPQAKGLVARASAPAAEEAAAAEDMAAEKPAAAAPQKTNTPEPMIETIMNRKEEKLPHQLMEKPIPNRRENAAPSTADEPVVEDGGSH